MERLIYKKGRLAWGFPFKEETVPPPHGGTEETGKLNNGDSWVRGGGSSRVEALSHWPLPVT